MNRKYKIPDDALAQVTTSVYAGAVLSVAQLIGCLWYVHSEYGSCSNPLEPGNFYESQYNSCAIAKHAFHEEIQCHAGVHICVVLFGGAHLAKDVRLNSESVQRAYLSRAELVIRDFVM
jgi:hypothetical protein